MAACCSGNRASSRGAVSPGFRKALWVALVINAAMFLVEIFGGVQSGQVTFFGLRRGGAATCCLSPIFMSSLHASRKNLL